eukprot:m.28257 g.28257  ORF g.28257 m.28257 type:complete len:88 (+) comp6028_c0_seq1:347-610(+)
MIDLIFSGGFKPNALALSHRSSRVIPPHGPNFDSISNSRNTSRSCANASCGDVEEDAVLLPTTPFPRDNDNAFPNDGEDVVAIFADP